MKITDYVASHINEFPTIAEVLGIKVTTQQATPKSASNVRSTVAELDFNNKVIRLTKTNPTYQQDIKCDDMAQMYKQSWYVLHSPKVVAVSFIINFYGSTVKSMISYCEMIGLDMNIITPNGKFSSSKDYIAWYGEQATRSAEHQLSVENTQLIVSYCPELLRFAKRSVEELIEVLRSQIKTSGYDVSLHSIITTDGLNHGTVEDNLGKHEWSRTYTKHYERYDQTLNDLLNMYISCKYYQSVGIEAETDGIGRHDVDSYTNDVITEAIQIHERDEVVVPRCACGLGLQNYMN